MNIYCGWMVWSRRIFCTQIFDGAPTRATGLAGEKKKKSHATCQLPVVGRKSTLARRFAAHNRRLARSLDSFFFSAREPSSNQNHNRSHSLFKNKKLVSHMMVPHLRLGCILFWQLWTHLEWCCVLVKWIFLLEIWELMRFWLIDWLTFFFFFF